MTILRGTARILAAVTGLLLVYGITFTLEGMTTRIPISAVRELATGSAFIALWMLLFCSGLQDFVIVTSKQWVLWLGVVAATFFMYYFDRYTSLSLLTKAAMPPIAIALGLMPHFVRKMGFVFALSSLGAGIAGAVVLYYFAAASRQRQRFYWSSFTTASSSSLRTSVLECRVCAASGGARPRAAE